MTKVFGIGLSHTGTKSLNAALNRLGLRSIHWPLDRTTHRELSSGRYELSLLNEYDAITDITVAPFFRELDRSYRASKFILTVRRRESWIESLSQANAGWLRLRDKSFLPKYWTFFTDHRRTNRRGSWGALIHTLVAATHEKTIEFQRRAAYGTLAFEDPTRIGEVYDRHVEAVTAHFKDRPDDLLVLDICGGAGWAELCPFLGKPLRTDPFPHLRTQKRRARGGPAFVLLA